MTFSTAQGVSNEINVTPLIDILLVLLIIFMVITPLAPHGLDAQIPQQRNDGPHRESQRTVLIQVSKGAISEVIHVNGELVEDAALSARLTSIFATRAERVAFVTADSDLNFEQAAQVIDIAHAAGVDHVGLITSPLQTAASVSR